MKGSNTKEKSILFFTKNWLCYPTFNCHLDQILLKFNALFWQIFSLESLRKCDMKSITRHYFLQYIIKTRSYIFSNCINFKKQENMLLNNLQMDNFQNKTIVCNTEMQRSAITHFQFPRIMIHSTPRRYGEHRKTEIDNSSPAVGGITNAPNTNKSGGKNRISLKNRQKPLSIAMEVDNKQLRLETYVKLFFFFFFF